MQAAVIIFLTFNSFNLRKNFNSKIYFRVIWVQIQLFFCKKKTIQILRLIWWFGEFSFGKYDLLKSNLD